MQAMSNALEGARAYNRMMEKAVGTAAQSMPAVSAAKSGEISDWNAEVDRKNAAKAQQKELRRRTALLDAERTAAMANLSR